MISFSDINSNPSELSEKINRPNTDADHKRVTEDIEQLKLAAANEDLSQILLKENYQTDEVFDLNIGVHGHFDDFSYEHSIHSKALLRKVIYYN